MAMSDCTESSNRLGDPSYLNRLSSSLDKMRQQGSLCDVTIMVEDKRFPAHKAILSCASHYFESMFTSGYQESTSSEVTLPGTPDTFAQIIQFAYTGFFDLSPSNVVSILNMACFMQFERAVAVCKRFLRKNKDKITIDDCFEIWSLAKTYGGSLTKTAAIYCRHLVRNFHKCLESQNFLEHATVDFVLITCLGDEEIEAHKLTELKILQVVIAWLKFDWENRKEHTLNLMKEIRLGLVPPEDLKGLLTDAQIGGIEECKKLIEEVVALQSAEESDLEKPLSERYPHWFATRSTITALVSFCGLRAFYYKTWDDDDTSAKQGYWKELDKMAIYPFNKGVQQSCVGAGVTLLNGKIYAAGGYEGNSIRGEAVNNFCVYSIKKNRWEVLPPMKVKRAECCLVSHKGFIYAIGGWDDGEPIMSVERYSLLSNNQETKWESCADIKIQSNSPCAVSYKEGIVMCDEVTPFAHIDCGDICVQVYNPVTDTWHIVHKEEPDHSSGLWCLLTIQDGILYLVTLGGNCYITYRAKKLEINFQCDGGDGEQLPCICVDMVDIGEGCVDKANMRWLFKIQDKVFVSKGHSVFQIFPKIDSEGEADYQLRSKWGDLYKKNDNVIVFSFDKNRLCTLPYKKSMRSKTGLH